MHKCQVIVGKSPVGVDAAVVKDIDDASGILKKSINVKRAVFQLVL